MSAQFSCTQVCVHVWGGVTTPKVFYICMTQTEIENEEDVIDITEQKKEIKK